MMKHKKLIILSLFSLFFINLSLIKSANALSPIGLSFGVKAGGNISSSKEIKNNSAFYGADINLKLFFLRFSGEITYRNNFIKKDDKYVNSFSPMLNVYYDFASFTPLLKFYVGGGLGKNYINNFKDNTNTWNLGVGTTLSLIDIINLDIGYRYVDMGKYIGKSLYSNDIYVGLRVGF